MVSTLTTSFCSMEMKAVAASWSCWTRESKFSSYCSSEAMSVLHPAQPVADRLIDPVLAPVGDELGHPRDAHQGVAHLAHPLAGAPDLGHHPAEKGGVAGQACGSCHAPWSRPACPCSEDGVGALVELVSARSPDGRRRGPPPLPAAARTRPPRLRASRLGLQLRLHRVEHLGAWRSAPSGRPLGVEDEARGRGDHRPVAVTPEQRAWTCTSALSHHGADPARGLDLLGAPRGRGRARPQAGARPRRPLRA